MSINLTDEIEVKTKKGKLGAAKQIFLEGDTQTVEKEIQDINSRHNDLSSKHESLSSTVSEHTKQIESNQNQITANKYAQDEKNTSLDANMAKLNARDDQITELVKGVTATGGASVATAVTYDNTSSQLTSATVQGAVDELQGSKINKTSISQESGDAEDKVMSQKATTTAIADETTRSKAAEKANAQAIAEAVNMSPYFPFADTATFYYNPANNSGLQKDVAIEMFYGIMIDKGERTDKMYLGRIELNTAKTTLAIRLAINKVDVLEMPPIDKSINDVVFCELKEYNNSGYHGYIALNPSKFINKSGFITSETGGTFERFALSENIFNSNPLIETWLNANKISEVKSVFDDFEGNYVKYEQPSSDNDNLINQYYKTEYYAKAINERDGITTDIYSTKASSIYPYFLRNKREFFFSKDITNNREVNIQLKSQILLRELNNIKFETWIYFGLQSVKTKTISLNFQLGKMYPFLFSALETKISVYFSNVTDYSEAKNSRIEKVVTNNIIGDTVFYIDDYIELPTGGKLIHVTMEKDIPIRYGVLWLLFDVGYITPGNVFGEDISIINPTLRTNDKFQYTVDKSAYNSGYSLLKGDFLTMGKNGRINETSVKTPMNIKTRKGVNMEVIDNGNCADLVLKGDNLSNAKNDNTTLLQVSMENYKKPFDNTGKMYIQFGVKIEDCLKIKYFRHVSNVLFEPIRLLSEGIKLKSNNDYANTESFCIKVTDDGMDIVRLEMYNTGLLQMNIVSDEVIQELRFYNFCVSEKPIDPVDGVFISEQRAKYGNIAGKTFTIFGDSEFNVGLQYLNVVSRLGMPCYNAAYGGHKMAWAGGVTDIDAVTKSWLYTWDIRKLVLANNTDFYIFCVSTNDSGAGGSYYEYQSVEDEDVQYVLDNYPAYGDDDETVNSKLAIFNGLDTNTKNEKFNMTSVYCAYIEQILEANPNAKIILANSPITCTGLLTKEKDENNKGIWAEGQNPRTARIAKKPVFDKLSELMNRIGEKYNLPVIDFYRNVGLTFENYTNYCIDGTHWTDINNGDVLANTSPIQNREGDLLVKYLTELIH